MTTVVNLRHRIPYDVYIGRPRAGQAWGFGNPFVVGTHGVQGECVGLFETWLETGENFGCKDATELRRQWILRHIPALKDKVLGCFCKPRACHGDVLARLADQEE